MTIQDHADAFLNLLRAAPAIGGVPLTVYPDADGNVPGQPARPYVRVYVHISTPPGTRLPGMSDRVVARAYCHCVGDNDTAARAVAQRVRDALLDVKPAIAGRVSFPIRHESDQPPGRDESTGELVIDQVDVYRLQTDPA